MAFTASGSNPITYQGTPQADQGIFTTSNFIALGEGGDDLFNLGSVAQATVLGGQGNDLVTQNILTTASSSLQGGYVNGNLGNDTLGQIAYGVSGTISAFLGGQGNDTIFVGNLQSTQVNGNIGNDIINVGINGGALNTANSSIYGGQGDDALNIVDGGVARTYIATQFGGNLGNDSITVTLTTTGTNLTNSTFGGGDGNDTINGAGSVVGLNIIGDGADGGFQPQIGGADFLVGGQVIDTISGGGLNDVLNGGTTTTLATTQDNGDLLSGGTGSNRFVFGANQSSSSETISYSSFGALSGNTLTFDSVAVDTITDWAAAAGGANVIQNALSSSYVAATGNLAAAGTYMTVLRGSVVSTGTGNFAFQVNTTGADALAVAISATGSGVTLTAASNATLLSGAGAFSFSQANFI